MDGGTTPSGVEAVTVLSTAAKELLDSACSPVFAATWLSPEPDRPVLELIINTKYGM